MSASQTTQPSQGPPPKARNPVEKLLVRGFIVVLLVLVAVEGYGWNSQKTALDALLKRIKAHETENAPEVTETDVRAAVGSRQPIQTEQYASSGTVVPASKKLEIYSWFTFNPVKKREVWVYYARKGMKEEGPATVIEVSPDEGRAAPIEESTEAQTTDGAAPSMTPMSGMMGGPPGAGGGRGRGRGRPSAESVDAEKTDEGKAADAKTEEPQPDAEKSDDKKPDSE